jgi:hypothetical protein
MTTTTTVIVAADDDNNNGTKNAAELIYFSRMCHIYFHQNLT